MPDVMIDLETVGTRAKDGIISLGAVVFDKTGLKDEFYVAISIAEQKKLGFGAQQSTLEWWKKQNADAQKAAFSGTTHIEDAIKQFTQWLPDHDGVRIWGNGAAFDNVILSAAYGVLRLHTPWKFYNDRCYRTVKAMFPDVISPPRVGTHHHALDDAKTQALHLVEIVKAKGFPLN